MRKAFVISRLAAKDFPLPGVRKAGACAVFEQKEKRQAEQESRRKTYNLPFGKVERYFCLDFG